MDHATEIEALMMVLQTVMDGHPNHELAVAQVDALIAEMPEGAADPLRAAVESVRGILI